MSLTLPVDRNRPQSIRDAQLDALTVMHFCGSVRLGDPISQRALRLMSRAVVAYMALRTPDTSALREGRHE